MPTITTVPPTIPTPTPAPVPVIPSKTLREAEKLLERAGFNPGDIDGKSSPAFEKALKQFQSAWGVRPSGQLDARTLSLLRKTGERIAAHKKDEYVSVGQRSSAIKTIEQRLARLGYDVGKADGIYSRETADAVKRFKADQPELKNSSGAIAKAGRTALRKEVAALQHAPERRRVKPSKLQRTLDAQTKVAAARGLSEGAKGNAVKNLQKHLRAAGFDPQHVNGVFDERTKGALKNFQAKSGLPATGELNGKTWKALSKSYILTDSKPSPAQALHERSGAVKASEKLLKKLGLNPGKVDGLFDKKTEKAVKAFEKKHHLKVDGKISEGELAKMKKVASQPRVTVNMRRLARNARSVAMSMGGFSSQGLCATGVSRAILKTYGVKVWGNGNQIDDNLPKDKFRRVHIPLSKALKMPGLVLTWEHTSTRLGSIFGHTAITLGDGHSSASDFIESNTLAGNLSRTGLKIFMPIK